MAALVGVILGFGAGELSTPSGPEPPPHRTAPGDEAAGDRQSASDGRTRLTVSISGDILIHSPVWARARELAGGEGYDFRPMLSEIAPLVRRADLALCHLETPLTHGEPQGFPLFAAPAELARAIGATGWDACSTASNHTLDQGLDGVIETARILRGAGVPHAGSAASPAQARRPLLLRAGGARVAFLAYTTSTNGLPVPEPWSVSLAEPERILADARRARERGADAVIVNVHWCDEDSSEVNARQWELAGALTRSRAVTAVFGQGPHVVQPVARVQGSPIVFSTGNLLSNQTPACCAPGSQDGMMAMLELVIDGRGDRVATVRYVPVWVRHPDYTVLPVGPAVRREQADAASLRASYERTVSVAGKGRGVTPVPRRLP